uniref:Uncharacterized protein n=1 Tax=Meloidogyne incognita TaxID=6306 RepID=A0A914N0F0_MELIC
MSDLIKTMLNKAGAVFSISSMCLGMESTHWIFSHFVRVDKMEQVAGPIWPFNIAILSFSGAALDLHTDTDLGIRIRIFTADTGGYRRISAGILILFVSVSVCKSG